MAGPGERGRAQATAADPRLSQLVADVSTAFTRATADDLDAVVATSIARLGTFEHVDVTYACIITADVVTDSWEWCGPGVTNTSPPQVGDAAPEFFNAAYELLRLGITLPAEDLRSIELEPNLRERFARMDAQAILLVPVMDGEELVGVVGALVTGRTHAWPTEQVARWELLARMMVMAVRRTRYRAELAAVEARMRRIAAYVPEALVTVDPAGVITWHSTACSVLAGRPEDEIVGSTVWSLLRPEDADGCREVLDVLFGGGRPDALLARTAGDTPKWVEVSGSLLADRTEVAAEVVLSLRDVDRRETERRYFAASASTDALTGLLNRRGWRDVLDRVGHSDVPLVLAVVDLDGFKAVNDTEGHARGDEVLTVVARRLAEVVGERGAVARLGGDEFGVLLVRRVGNVRPVLDDLLRACDVEVMPHGPGSGLRVTASIGAVLSYGGTDVGALVGTADEAMYRVKHGGKRGWELVGDVERPAVS